MTQGCPGALLVKFALPFMFGNLFQQMYTFADTMIVGNVLGVEALAALGTVEWLIFLMLGAIQGMTHGFSVIISQRYGKNDVSGLRRAVWCAFWLSMGGIVVFFLGGQCLIVPALRLLQVPKEIVAIAARYLRIIYGGIPVVFLYHFMAALLRALGDSKTPLAAVTISSFCNIVLDLFFVIFWGWGVTGAAASTVLAQLISVFYCFRVIRENELLQIGRTDRVWEWEIAGEEIRMGIPLAVQNMVTAAGGLVVQSVINRFGVLFMGAYTAANKLYGLLEIPASSYGYTMTVFAGQNMGAGEKERIRKGLRSGILISVGTAVLMSAVMIGAGKQLLSYFISGSEIDTLAVLQIGSDFLFLLGLFFPLLYILYTLRGCVQGMGNAGLPVASSFAQLGMRMCCAVFLTRVIGEYGIFWGEILAWAAADSILFLGYEIQRIRGSRI